MLVARPLLLLVVALLGSCAVFKGSPADEAIWLIDGSTELLDRAAAQVALARHIGALGVELNTDAPLQVFRSDLPAITCASVDRATSARVIVAFKVNEAGRAESIRALAFTHATFRDATLAAVEGWEFSPAIVDGEPRRLDVKVELELSCSRAERIVEALRLALPG